MTFGEHIFYKATPEPQYVLTLPWRPIRMAVHFCYIFNPICIHRMITRDQTILSIYSRWTWSPSVPCLCYCQKDRSQQGPVWLAVPQNSLWWLPLHAGYSTCMCLHRLLWGFSKKLYLSRLPNSFSRCSTTTSWMSVLIPLHMGHTHFEGAAASICPLIASGHFAESVNGVAGAQSSLTLPLSAILSHGMTILQSVMRISSILFSNQSCAAFTVGKAADVHKSLIALPRCL